MSNPFLERYSKIGQSFDPKSVHVSQAIRINTLKIKADDLLKRLEKEKVMLTKVPYLGFGYIVESSTFSLGAAPEHLLGHYYVQEAAAQIPVQILNPSSEDLVLDMAAAPGGKTTQIAQYMKNEGAIVALDNNSRRLMTLRNNIERLGVTNVIVYQKDAKFVSDLGLQFDKILLDAPCSGNFCIDRDWFEKRTVEDFKNASKEQKKLLASAYEVLKNKGVLVYSTCSLEPEENEFVVEWFLKEYPDMTIQKIDLNIGEDGIIDVFGQKLDKRVKFAKRLWPHKTGTQGFFIACFRKGSE
jgi:NOL1/NOP2/sun family putative RNA methylase